MIKIYGRYLKPYIGAVIGVAVFQILQTTCTLYLPNMNAHIIDNGVTVGDMGFITREGALMLAITALQIVFSITATYFGAKAAMAMARDIRRDVFYKIESFSVREISQFGAPTLITRSTNDIQQVQQVTMFIMTLIITAPIMFIGGILMSLEQDVPLSGVIAATFPVIVIVALFFVTKMTPYFRKFQKKVDRMNEILREQVTGVRVVRAFVRENSERKRFFKTNHDLYDLNMKTGRLMVMLFPIFMLIINLSILAIMWFGGLRVNSGDMEIGAITAFITYMMYIMMAVLMSSMVFVMLPRAQVSAKRIRQVLKTKTTVEDAKSPVTLDNPRGELAFHDVDFRYAGASHPVLEKVNFVAKPGQTTAIIGSTGSGKSTLLRLIPRLFDATAGSVTLDDVDVKKISLEELNSIISVIPQKSYLFSGTVESNLRFGKDDATLEEMWEAIEISQSADFLLDKAREAAHTLGESTDDLEVLQRLALATEVSQGGTNFSGGQRQRLSIARAVIRKPKIYQFDDSFSALDYATDANLRGALRSITSDATVIIVAQRVSTIRHADQILVLDTGQIVGTGTHEELLETCQTYKEIVNSQLSAEETLK